jgi:hypothetical protein
MRFPRINRLRWDKPPGEADRLETLERMLAAIEGGRSGVMAPLPLSGSNSLPDSAPQAGK